MPSTRFPFFLFSPATLKDEIGKMRLFYLGGLILPNSGIDVLGGKTKILLVEDHVRSGKLTVTCGGQEACRCLGIKD